MTIRTYVLIPPGRRHTTLARLFGLSAGLLAAILLVAAPAAAQQTGTISGIAISEETGEPLQAVQIGIEGSPFQALSRANGRFTIEGVPAGTHTVVAILIGFASATESVTVTAGETEPLELRLDPRAIALSEIVVTGVVGATQRTKLPFVVSQVRTADLPVPTASAGTILAGKVAGAEFHSGSGNPGATPSILLRGVTSLDATGRSQEPLTIVDGVILGTGGLTQIDALDIESVEIVKGAAAASLYGSRAANGVVQIRTKRGAALRDNEIRYTVRSEYGRSNLASAPEDLKTLSHEYALSDRGMFITEDGEECEWLRCGGRPTLAGNAPWREPGATVTDWNTVQNVAWPGRTYDQVERFFQNNDFIQNYVSASGRSGATNFHVSAQHLRERGVLPGLDGLERFNFRANVDQAINEKLIVQATAFYSKSEADDFPESQGNALFQLTRMPAGVDLTSEDPFAPGQLVLNADIANQEQPNPLYTLNNEDRKDDRSRFLGSANLRYTPVDWLDIDVNASFDRRDRDQQVLRPKGYRTINRNANLNEGTLSKTSRLDEALNASVTATFRRNLGEHIRNTTQLRYLVEDDFVDQQDVGGFEFAVGGVPTIDNLNPDNVSGGSFEQTVRADGYFAITNFDILDRYVVDALIRNDGSSLFGGDERRQWYYRVAGAWRLSEEPFFNVPGIDELKLRYSLGTAGGRPRFEAQYETFSISQGRVTPVALGNETLKPEFSIEQEAGIDASLFNNRVALELTYARANTKDQILNVPLPSFAGFGTQWQNAGTVESKTWEASLDVLLVDTRDFSWSTRVLFDRTRSEITEMNLPAFRYGVPGQALGNVFFAREGEKIGTFYGTRGARSCGDLPSAMGCDGFAVNDEGWLVWVGAGGFDSEQWGTDSDVLVRGAPVKWGTPFPGECINPETGESTLFCPVGNSLPEFTINFSQTFRFKGLSLYALASHVNGFDVYNQPLQWNVFAGYAGIMNQNGKPESARKPIGYYTAGLYNGLGGLQPSNAFVEDATFTKLREVALSYRFTADQLAGIPGLSYASGLGITLIGRNLFTITDYRGYDPEVGKAGGDTGSSAIARVDGFQYPNFRTWTAAFELNF
ncbi:MAG: SusC/RagA family TonB-linked outer membrane protein [Longimicrobiales bacterium]